MSDDKAMKGNLLKYLWPTSSLSETSSTTLTTQLILNGWSEPFMIKDWGYIIKSTEKKQT